MVHDDNAAACRLCHAPLRTAEMSRRLCVVCDEYAQHVALQSNQRLEKVVGELEHEPIFVAASRNVH